MARELHREGGGWETCKKFGSREENGVPKRRKPK
jgi:hypothetical protein